MSPKPRRPPSDDGLFIVGLVGPPGGGKTTVARSLGRDGAAVIDADALGHAVTDSDPDVRAALTAEYGDSVYRSGGLDRARVAANVFRDPAALERLNRLVHPRIVARIRARLGELGHLGFRGVVAVDAALMLDWGLERECDAVMAVVSSLDRQVERLAADRGWSREEVERRVASQRSPEALRAAADVTLENLGTEAELERAAREAIGRLRAAVHDPNGAGRTPC